MSLPSFASPGKANYRLRPSPLEGRHIKYALSLLSINSRQISEVAKVTQVTVCNVISGRRRSARVEAEIARILGKQSWNDVVAEARAATREFATPVVRSPSRGRRRAS